jgi:hypothetical protein
MLPAPFIIQPLEVRVTSSINVVHSSLNKYHPLGRTEKCVIAWNENPLWNQASLLTKQVNILVQQAALSLQVTGGQRCTDALIEIYEVGVAAPTT